MSEILKARNKTLASKYFQKVYLLSLNATEKYKTIEKLLWSDVKMGFFAFKGEKDWSQKRLLPIRKNRGFWRPLRAAEFVSFQDVFFLLIYLTSEKSRNWKQSRLYIEANIFHSIDRLFSFFGSVTNLFL